MSAAASRPGDPPADVLPPVLPEVRALLGRIDHVLDRYGVTPAWPAATRGLREYAALPGDVFAHVAACDPAAVHGAAVTLDATRGGHQATADDLATATGGLYWGGPARQAFDAYWSPIAGRLSGADVSMVDTLAATADHGTRVAAWLADLRRAVVGFFADAVSGGIALALAGVPADGNTGGGNDDRPAGTDSAEPADVDDLVRAASHGAALFYDALDGAVRRGLALAGPAPGLAALPPLPPAPPAGGADGAARTWVDTAG